MSPSQFAKLRAAIVVLLLALGAAAGVWTASVQHRLAALEAAAPTASVVHPPGGRIGSSFPSPTNAGTCASRPAALGSGTWWICTDAPVSYYDSPTTFAWLQMVDGVYIAKPDAVAGSHTVVSNNSSAAIYAIGDAYRFVSFGTRANVSLAASASLTSSGTWAVTGAYRIVPSTGTYPEVGVCVATGTTTSDTAYCMSQWWNAGIAGLHQLSVTCGTQTRSVGTEVGGVQEAGVGKLLWFRILADGSTAHFQYGNDGWYWQEWSTISTPSGLNDYGTITGLSGNFSSGTIESFVYQEHVSAVTALSVSNATNASPIVVTTTAAHGLETGDLVRIQGVGGNTNANTTQFVTVLTTTTFQIFGVNGNAAYTSGGTVVNLSR